MTIHFLKHFSFGDNSVLMTFQFWWHCGFDDISVLVIFQFRWHFSFQIFQFLWHFSFGDILVLVIFQLWWHFSFGDILVLLTFQFGLVWSGLVWSGMVIWASSKARVTLMSAQRCNHQTNKKQKRKYSVYPDFFVGLVAIRKSGDEQKFSIVYCDWSESRWPERVLLCLAGDK